MTAIAVAPRYSSPDPSGAEDALWVVGWILGTLIAFTVIYLQVRWAIRVMRAVETTARVAVLQEQRMQQQSRPGMPPAAAPPNPTQSLFG